MLKIKTFPKMLMDVETAMPKSIQTRCRDVES